MNKSNYQMLRWAVQQEIIDVLGSYKLTFSDVNDLTNSLSRIFLQRLAQDQADSQRSKREFLTFRRSPDIKPPSWAYRKPGIDSRLPKL